jgi:hypothetical protein
METGNVGTGTLHVINTGNVCTRAEICLAVNSAGETKGFFVA